MFNNKLEVGQLAMIINTRLPENRWLIGSVVTVEAFVKVGDDLTEFFDLPHNVTLGPTKYDAVMVAGCKTTTKTLDKRFSMKPGHSLFNAKNLMPIPKLKETEIQKEKELDLA